MATVIKAPQKWTKEPAKFYIFLGGSIEMGEAENWQDRLVEAFSEHDNVVFINPRRDDWDASWEQDPTPGTQFHEQVSWELESQDMCDLRVYYYADGTKSPITLLEMGLYSDWHNIVRVSPNFWRYGNVIMTCEKTETPHVETFEELVVEMKELLLFHEILGKMRSKK